MNMVLIYDICEKRSEVFKFKANNNIKIITIKICTNNKESKVLNQDLKNQEVETVIKESIAKGDNKINIFIIM